MIQNEELEVRLMFLEEAQEHIDAIEDCLAGLENQSPTFKQQIDGALRAAHSLKGGAAMMQFETLSEAAHRLEDIFKLLRSTKLAIDLEIERALLRCVDLLRQIVDANRRGRLIDLAWLEEHAEPVFIQLSEKLGDSQGGEEEFEEEIDVVSMMFETEVENYLMHLEELLEIPQLPANLGEELTTISTDLAGLGEMLDLPNFVLLCQFVNDRLVASPEQVEAIARAALSGWRRSQALVLTGHAESIPPNLNLDLVTEDLVPETLLPTENTDSDNFSSVPNAAAFTISDLFSSPQQEEQLDDFDAANTEVFTISDLFSSPPQEEQLGDFDSSIQLEIQQKELDDPSFSIQSEIQQKELGDPDSSTQLEIQQEEVVDDLDIFEVTDSNLLNNFDSENLTDTSPSSDDIFQIFEDQDNLVSPFGLDFLDLSQLNDPSYDPFSLENIVEAEDLFVNHKNNDQSIDNDATVVITREKPVSTEVSTDDDETVIIIREKPVSTEINANSRENLISTEINSDDDETVVIIREETVNAEVNLFSSEKNSEKDAAINQDNHNLENEKEMVAIAENLDTSNYEKEDPDPEFWDNLDELVDSVDSSPLLTVTQDEKIFSANQETLKTIKDIANFEEIEEIENFPDDLWTNLDNIAINSDREAAPITTNGVENKSKNFSAYIISDPDASDEITLASLKSPTPNSENLLVADTLHDLFDDLDASEQEEGNLPESLPTSVSELANIYLKETNIKLPINRLNQLQDLSDELLIDRNSLDTQLKHLRSLLKSLNERISDLNGSNTQLSQIYDLMTIQPDFNTHYSDPKETAVHPTSLTNAAAAIAPSLEIVNAQATHSMRQDSFDSLEMDRYNELHSLSQSVMETIVQLQEVSEDIDLNLGEAEQSSLLLNRNFKQLQTELAQIRMRPLSDVVGKFPRVIRSLSLQYGKQVELVIKGGETLIDRAVLDLLSDPLNHILRNAFDHGIEDAAIRLNQGKPETGHIEISANNIGGVTVINIQDDGGGIDVEKIRARVKQSAIAARMDISAISMISEEKLLALIFEPGFSTADTITSLSGRGVGLDVVNINLKQIGAKIDINTKLGVGTNFRITLPLALTSIRILVVETNFAFFAIPCNFIEEVIPYFEDGMEIFEWKEQLLPVVDLSNYFQINCAYNGSHAEVIPTTTAPSILVVRQDHRLIAMLVNACWGEQEVSVRQPEGNIALPLGFSGCVILGNSQVVPLLNLNEIKNLGVKEHETTPITATATSSVTGEYTQVKQPSDSIQVAQILKSSSHFDDQPSSILVVDDSVNVRRYLALTLKKAGFQVEQAKDGEDALAKMSSGLKVDAVISDVEMPRLDGYGLLVRIRGNESLSQLPVVMLTSRSSDKHRQIAMNLGATAYFCKPYQEQELVQTLKQLTTKLPINS